VKAHLKQTEDVIKGLLRVVIDETDALKGH
jgi:hypothetical protein